MTPEEKKQLRNMHPVHFTSEDDFTVEGEMDLLELSEMLPDGEERVRSLYDSDPYADMTDEDHDDMWEFIDEIQEEYS